MCDIVILIFLCQRMGNMLRAKGRKPGLMQVLTVVSWYGGGILGAIAVGVAQTVANGGQPVEGLDIGPMIGAFVGGVSGVVAMFLIALVLSPVDESDHQYEMMAGPRRTKLCPMCGHQDQKSFATCPACGEAV